MHVEATLTDAVTHHRAGRISEARTLYHQVLDAEPDNADALHLLGLAHHADGDNDRGADLIRRAIEHRPTDARYWYNLGVVEEAAGHLDEAERALDEATRLQPVYPDALVKLGDVLVRHRRPAQAIDAYRRALAQDAAHAAALNNLASTLLRAGDRSGALDLLTRAAELRPGTAEVHDNLRPLLLERLGPVDAVAFYQRLNSATPTLEGRASAALLLVELDRRDEALSECMKALVIAPGHRTTAALAARLLFEAGRAEEALDLLHVAIERNGDAAAPLWDLLGNLLRQLSFPEAAEQCWERAMELDPDRVEIPIRLVERAIDRGELDDAARRLEALAITHPGSAAAATLRVRLLERRGDTDAARELATQLFARGLRVPALAITTATLARDEDELRAAIRRLHEHRSRLRWPSQHVSLDFALGDAHHRLREYDEAFAAYAKANAARIIPADAHRAEDLLDRVLATLTPEAFGQAARSTDADPTAILVTGLPRSGTSLVEQMLAMHPEVAAAGEIHTLVETLVGLTGEADPASEYPEVLTQLTEAQATAAGRRYLQRVRALTGSDAPRITDKSPKNVNHLAAVHQLLPGARILRCVRNPMDIGLSVFRHNLGGLYPFAFDLTRIGEELVRQERLVRYYRDVLGVPVYDVIYEDLVRDPVPTLRAALAHLGLEWDDALLSFHTSTRHVPTASYAQVRQPLYTTAVDQWRRYERHLAPLREVLEAGGLFPYPHA